MQEAPAAPTPPTPSVPMVQYQVTISSTGRPFVIAIPSDISDREILAAAAWVTDVLPRLRDEAAVQARGGLVLPTPVLVRP